jgi:hypothetical protein
MIYLSLMTVIAACISAARKWKIGLFIAVVIAFIQDPLRKLVPEQPMWFILFVGFVYASAMIGAVSSGVSLWPNKIVGWNTNLRSPFFLYVSVVVLQAIHSQMLIGNPIVPALGLISYLLPFAALVFAYQFAVNLGAYEVGRFYRFYLICASVAVSTILFQVYEFDWLILGEVGVGLEIHSQGRILKGLSGILRASEIAAWHAAIGASVAILVFSYKSVKVHRILQGIVLAAALLYIGILSGRRKLIPIFLIFLSSYYFLVNTLNRRNRGTAIATAIVGIAAYATQAISFDEVSNDTSSSDSTLDIYLTRGATVFDDMISRFLELGLGPIEWAYESSGFFGYGLGVGTQGTGQFLQDEQMQSAIGASEGGLGRLMVELGVPGLIISAIFGVALLRHVWSILLYSRHSTRINRLACGLAAILIANFASFSVATQAFGDTFVLIFLGITLGFLFATPVLLQQEFVGRRV